MKKIRLLTVSFDADIQPWELTKFRGAMIHKVGAENEWFHNHDNANGGYHNRYPLIQYKIDTHQKHMRPMLVCLDHGIEEAHHFFSKPDWTIHIGDRSLPLRIARLQVHQHTLHAWQQLFTYRVHKWQAFNTDSYKEWKTLERLSEKYEYLEKKLAANLLAFAGGIGWQIEEHFEVRLTALQKEEWIEYKGIKVLCFTLDFKTNLSLPDFIGVGKGASLGMGVVRKIRDEKNGSYEK